MSMGFQRLYTFKFSTIILIIVGLLTPCWPVTLPLFWVMAYITYRNGIDLAPDEMVVYSGPGKQGQLYLTNKRVVCTPSFSGVPIDIMIKQIDQIEEHPLGSNTKLAVSMKIGRPASLLLTQKMADLVLRHVEEYRNPKA